MGASIDSSPNPSGVPLLQGQVALITGASRGIGAATALLFARHGAAVGVNYHSSAGRAREVVEAIQAFGGRAIAVQASADNAQEVGAMVQQVEQELGPIDTLVMNAIAGSKPAESSARPAEARSSATFNPFLDSTWEQYQNIVMRTLAGVYVPARAVVPLMVERKHGNLIAVSSTLARAICRLRRPGCRQSERRGAAKGARAGTGAAWHSCKRCGSRRGRDGGFRSLHSGTQRGHKPDSASAAHRPARRYRRSHPAPGHAPGRISDRQLPGRRRWQLSALTACSVECIISERVSDFHRDGNQTPSLRKIADFFWASA